MWNDILNMCILLFQSKYEQTIETLKKRLGKYISTVRYYGCGVGIILLVMELLNTFTPEEFVIFLL